MSENELRQQNETIKTMAEQISAMKKLASYSPLYAILGMLLSGAFSLGVFLVKYDNNLVKQPQLASFKAQVIKGDSIANVRINTTNKRIDNLPVIRFTRVIQRNGKEIEIN